MRTLTHINTDTLAQGEALLTGSSAKLLAAISFTDGSEDRSSSSSSVAVGPVHAYILMVSVMASTDITVKNKNGDACILQSL